MARDVHIIGSVTRYGLLYLLLCLVVCPTPCGSSGRVGGGGVAGLARTLSEAPGAVRVVPQIVTGENHVTGGVENEYQLTPAAGATFTQE